MGKVETALTDPRVALSQFVELQAASFLMGDDCGRRDERPAHEVALRAFLIARTPVTNAEYCRYLSATAYPAPRFWGSPAFASPRQPVVGVAWADAVAYCAWLSLELGGRCRLPTEAEWEYAARGGLKQAAFAWGDELPEVEGRSLANLNQSAPEAVGASPANGFGLRDMGFNVHEWCLDWYAPNYYQHSSSIEPQGPDDGERRVSRGGAWRHQVKVSRCAARSSLPPAFQYNDYGFRVVAEM